MFIEKAQMRKWLSGIIIDKGTQGHEIEGLEAELNKLPDSYEALYEFSVKISKLPIRKGWKYIEPSDLEGIKKETSGDWTRPKKLPLDRKSASEKAKQAFLSSVCGCILGKPVEVNPDHARLVKALKDSGQYPLNDYISEKTLEALGSRHRTWQETVREKIRYAAPDDDLNYSIIGMLALETGGINFTREQLMDIWLNNIPIGCAWGPERTLLLKAGVSSQVDGKLHKDEWADVYNYCEEQCGAMIRADAYGYAAPGLPGLAAELAWRDAYMTHRRTGVYGSMFAAALISLSFVMKDREGIFREALKFVPKKSRFYEIVADQVEMISASGDFETAYTKIQKKYGSYQHCKIYMETGTLFNTLKFAEDIGDGICRQVIQGNDTDSYGCTAGSILGAYFGPGKLEAKWLKPFNNEIRTFLASFPERDLNKLAERMGRLPGLIETQL